MRVFLALIAAVMLAIAADERALRSLVHSAVPAAPRHVEGCVEADITPGSVVEGSLTINDCSLRLFDPNARIGLRTDAYKLVINTSLIVKVKIESAEFEPDVFILDKAGELLAADASREIDQQARATIHLPAGTYTLLATAVTGTGAYQISVQGDAPRKCDIPVITSGQEVTGSFSASDCRLVDLAPFETQTILIDLYALTLTDRKVVALKYSSATVMGVLALSNGAGMILASSEMPDLNTAALASAVPDTYLVYVAALDENYGDYKVISEIEDLRSCSSGVINPGESANGELTNVDCRDLDIFVPGSDVSPTDPWKLDVKDRTLATLTLRSTQFDSFLGLANAENKAIAYNDDFEESPSTDSQIKMSLSPGQYSALVSRYEGTGVYTLNFSSEPLRACDIPMLGAGRVTGTLAAQDCRVLDLVVPSADLTPADAYRLVADAKGIYSFDVTSVSFLSVIRLYDKAGAVIYARQGTAASRNAKFSMLLAPGEYTVLISTSDRLGDYALTTDRREPAVCETSGALNTDGSTNGVLSSSDCAILDVLPGLAVDNKVDIYSLNVVERRSITFSADSEALPPMILVYDEKDALVASALNERFQTHAEVKATLPPGNYKVALTTLSPLTGAYTLTTRSQAPPAE